MTTHAMRSIRKAGGIDEYLLKAKESEIKYPKALQIKQEIIEARAAAQHASDAQLGRTNSNVGGGQSGKRGFATSSMGGAILSPLSGSSPVKCGIGLQELLWS